MRAVFPFLTDHHNAVSHEAAPGSGADTAPLASRRIAASPSKCSGMGTLPPNRSSRSAQIHKPRNPMSCPMNSVLVSLLTPCKSLEAPKHAGDGHSPANLPAYWTAFYSKVHIQATWHCGGQVAAYQAIMQHAHWQDNLQGCVPQLRLQHKEACL